MAGVDIRAVLSSLVSHARRLGSIATADVGPPLSEPTRPGVHYAVWLDGVRPVQRRSGLHVTSACVVLTGRLFLLAGPEQRNVEERIASATEALLAAYTGDFDLDGSISEVDLLGAHGQPLEVRSGWQRVGDATYRVATFTLPLLVDDVWEQEE